MIERGEQLRLAPEPRDPIWIGRDFRGQHLECHVAAESDVAGAVHLAHSAGPEKTRDFEAADVRTACEHAGSADYTDGNRRADVRATAGVK